MFISYVHHIMRNISREMQIYERIKEVNPLDRQNRNVKEGKLVEKNKKWTVLTNNLL